jgi:hypothetical protein
LVPVVARKVKQLNAKWDKAFSLQDFIEFRIGKTGVSVKIIMG